MYCHTGPLARCVSDLVLLQNVMCGPDPSDIATLKPKLVLPHRYEPIRGWKIAYSMDLGFYEVEEQVRQNTLNALGVFRDLGASVEEVEIGWNEDVLAAGMNHLCHLFGYSLLETYEEHGDLMTTYASRFALDGKRSTTAEFRDSIEVAARMYPPMGALLERFQLFVCPTNNLAAVPAEHDQSRDPGVDQRQGGGPHARLGDDVALQHAEPLSGDQHSLRAQGRRRADGHATVGPTYEDARVFQAASAYEAAAGQWYVDAANRPPLQRGLR